MSPDRVVPMRGEDADWLGTFLTASARGYRRTLMDRARRAEHARAERHLARCERMLGALGLPLPDDESAPRSGRAR